MPDPDRIHDLAGGPDDRAHLDEGLGADGLGEVYDQLRDLARAFMRGEREGHSLQPTELVNEACLRLYGGADLDDVTRGRFLGQAARVMRQVLVDHARRRGAAKRGGDRRRVTLRGLAAGEASRDILLDSLALALDWLESEDPRLAALTDWHYFGGMTGDQIAAQLNVSRSTVNRELSLARALLLSRIDEIESDRP